MIAPLILAVLAAGAPSGRPPSPPSTPDVCIVATVIDAASVEAVAATECGLGSVSGALARADEITTPGGGIYNPDTFSYWPAGSIYRVQVFQTGARPTRGQSVQPRKVR